MRYGIAMFPSKELQDKANAYRKRYDPHYSNVPPHITLKEPFELENDEIDLMIKQFRSIADNHEPVDIEVKKVSSFHPVNNVIYFKIDEHPNLMRLQENLHENELGDDREYQFVPHITIAQDLSDEEHADILQSLKMMDVHHKETIDRFQLLYQLDNESWTVYETFHLQKKGK
ncbi:YjcG family protein [Tuberibacillus sp. Marseille-P3662]|uniref:YjcG family protein n=1 Tax=Tuberibacillus sp. Marseille-P3662 TaxID=1965358 RepID=UPI000A1C83AE|nr:YjcG family protein [Tuberibacillus sp. Marseille-P3662]